MRTGGRASLALFVAAMLLQMHSAEAQAILRILRGIVSGKPAAGAAAADLPAIADAAASEAAPSEAEAGDALAGVAGVQAAAAGGFAGAKKAAGAAGAGNPKGAAAALTGAAQVALDPNAGKPGHPAKKKGRPDISKDAAKHCKASDLVSGSALKQRQDRLRNGKVVSVYHMTTNEVCKLIMASEFNPSVEGEMGIGVYFAATAKGSTRKLPPEQQGCLLEAQVRLGRTKTIPPCDLRYNTGGAVDLTPRKMLKSGHDSTWTRGGCKSKTDPEYCIPFVEQIMSATAHRSKHGEKGALIGKRTWSSGGIGKKAMPLDKGKGKGPPPLDKGKGKGQAFYFTNGNATGMDTGKGTGKGKGLGGPPPSFPANAGKGMGKGQGKFPGKLQLMVAAEAKKSSNPKVKKLGKVKKAKSKGKSRARARGRPEPRARGKLKAKARPKKRRGKANVQPRPKSGLKGNGKGNGKGKGKVKGGLKGR